MQDRKQSNTYRRTIGHTFGSVALLLLAAVLFALSHPNILNFNGFFIIAYGALIPVFLLAHRVKWWQAPIAGILCNSLSYCFFAYWLGTFHPLAQLLVSGMLYSFYGFFLFLALKAADILFPRRGWLVQGLVWLVYEYLKSQWFAGFPYGIIGYTQWQQVPLIQCASVGGVWLVSAFVVFPSAFIAGLLKNGIKDFLPLFKKRYPYICGWALAVIAVCVWGQSSAVQYPTAETVKVAIVQPNADPWIDGFRAYEKNLDTLITLSTRALSEHPDTALVVWPETAFIPRIKWHYKFRENRDSYKLVERLLQYLDTAPAAFLIGNDDAEAVESSNGRVRLDYNAALLFRPGVNAFPPEPETYRKIHLVPFTEHFPYRKQLPWMHKMLVDADTHFWEKGSEYTVFTCNGLRFSSPICFEDTFGYLSAGFVRHGARSIINITNDAWAKSIPAQKQHLSMAVFRAVENHIPLVRSTVTGQSVYVLPSGKIKMELEPFCADYLIVDMPIIDTPTAPFQETFYTKYGDWLAYVFCAILVLCFVVRTSELILQKILTKHGSVEENR